MQPKFLKAAIEHFNSYHAQKGLQPPKDTTQGPAASSKTFAVLTDLAQQLTLNNTESDSHPTAFRLSGVAIDSLGEEELKRKAIPNYDKLLEDAAWEGYEFQNDVSSARQAMAKCSAFFEDQPENGEALRKLHNLFSSLDNVRFAAVGAYTEDGRDKRSYALLGNTSAGDLVGLRFQVIKS